MGLPWLEIRNNAYSRPLERRTGALHLQLNTKLEIARDSESANSKPRSTTERLTGSIMEWNSQTKVSAIEGVVACEIADGTALLNLNTSRYSKLNDTAALVWSELENSQERTCTLSHLCNIMMEAYDVEISVCMADIKALVQDLAEADLVHINF